jgi:hypothetical protein
MTRRYSNTFIIAAFCTVLITCDPDEVPPVNPPAPVAPAPVNTAPTAVIGADRTSVEEGDTFDLTAGTSSDPENNALTYQ